MMIFRRHSDEFSKQFIREEMIYFRNTYHILETNIFVLLLNKINMQPITCHPPFYNQIYFEIQFFTPISNRLTVHFSQSLELLLYNKTKPLLAGGWFIS